MTPKVPMSDTGAATAGMLVARPLRKKRKTTSTTRAMESSRLFSTSCSEARMVCERSMRTERSALSGSQERSCGIMAFTLSTVSMMLAPGERKTMSRMEGLPLERAIWRMSWLESVTVATSPRRMTTPPRSATMTLRYWAAVRSWSLATTVQEVLSFSRCPLGKKALAPAKAARTSSMVRPVRCRASGEMSTRTAGRAPPPTVTSPTPAIWLIFWASTVDAAS